MKTFIQVILTLFVIQIIYLLIYRKVFLAVKPAISNAAQMSISLILAVLIALVLWRKIGNISNTLPACIIAGGITFGIIGFILGFFGPMLLTPSSNQGPLLGFFFGLVGVALGLLAGGVYWYPKVKKKRGVYFDNKNVQKQ